MIDSPTNADLEGSAGHLEDMPPDDLIDALGDERRRRLITTLSSRESPVTIDTLAKRIAEGEHDVPIDQSTIEEIELSLLHDHLPKLADAGIIDYDLQERTVTYFQCDRLEFVLDVVESQPSMT